MKTVNFKKWIITAIVSLIFSLIFFGISIVIGGSSIIHIMDESNLYLNSSLIHNIESTFGINSENIQSWNGYSNDEDHMYYLF